MHTTTIKFVVLFSLILSSYTAKNQTIYFDKIYDSGLSNYQSEGIWDNSIHELYDGYLFVSFTMDNITSVRGTWLIKTDFVGDTVWTVNYVDTAYFETPQNMFQTIDEKYVIASSIAEFGSDDPSDVCLTKITGTGEIIWKKNYGSDTLYENVNYAIQTIDKGYAAIASRALPSQADAYLVKTDSVGNGEWEKTYGGGNYEAGVSIIETPDTGFLILGWTRSFGNGQRDFYLVKTDSIGNEQWYRTYGGGGMKQVIRFYF